MKATTLVVSTLLAFLATLAVAAQQREVDPRILEYDKGPATIDVSGYPEEMQQRYKVFERKCGKCHTLARAINSDFMLEDEWERYVKRMMRKAGTFITSKNGREIFEFMVYDSKVRRKELYEKRLKELGKTPGQ